MCATIQDAVVVWCSLAIPFSLCKKMISSLVFLISLHDHPIVLYLHHYRYSNNVYLYITYYIATHSNNYKNISPKNDANHPSKNPDKWLTSDQCLIQDKISTSPSPTDRRAVITPRGRRAARSSHWAIFLLNNTAITNNSTFPKIKLHYSISYCNKPKSNNLI